MDTPTKRIVSVNSGTTLQHAYELMREHGIRHLPVLEGKRLAGTISDRDLLMFASPVSDRELSFPGLPVSRVMSTDLITAREDVSLAVAAERMLAGKVGSLPIVAADGSFVGLITASDILQLVAKGGDTRRLPFRFELWPETASARESRV